MKKRLFVGLIILVALLALVLTACGGISNIIADYTGDNGGNSGSYDGGSGDNGGNGGNSGGNSGGNGGGNSGGNGGGLGIYTVKLYVTESQSYTFQTGELLTDGFDYDRAGYTFLGIFDAPVGGSMIARPNGEILQYIDKDCTLYCQWEARDILVKLNTPIGRIDGATTYSVKAGQSFPQFSTLLYNQNQYTFTGWEYDGDVISEGSLFYTGYDGAYDVYNLGTGVIELTAKFDLATLYVIFDKNDGSYERTEYTVSYGHNFDFTYPTVTADDREVMYWSETPSGGSPYVPDKITSDLILYAVWDDTKTVKFFITDENYYEVKYYRSRDVVVADGSRRGYEFDGWYNSNGFFGNPIDTFSFGSLVKAYYARWTPITYTIHLKDEAGLDNDFQRDFTYTVENEVDLPNDLEKKGYRFVGFADGEGNVVDKLNADTVELEELTATYAPVEYHIAYLNEDDRTSLAFRSIYYLDEMPVITSQRVGYSIDKFLLPNGEAYTSETFDYDNDLTLYVRYVAIEYDIVYHLNGGTNNAANPLKYTIEQSVTLMDPEKDYSLFEGWYSDEGCTEEFTGIPVGTHEEVNVYAYFRGLSFGVSLNAAGGVCQRDFLTVPYDENYSLPICTRDDYTFLGWYTTESGEEGVQLTDATGASLSKSTFHDTTTVYARYNRRYYVTIRSDYFEAFSLQVEDFYYEGDEVRLVLRWDDGYDFIGFYESEDAETALTHSQFYTFTMPAEDVSVFVKISPKFFYIYLDAKEGEVEKDFIVVDYGQIYELPIPVLGGKDFVGWICGDQFLTHEDGYALSTFTYKNDVYAEAVFIEISGATILYKIDDFDAMRTANTGYYVMATNLSLKGRNYVPFEFKGTLDGRGYTLQTDKNVFTNITGTVKNLIIDADIYVENPTTTEVVNAAILSINISGTVDNVTTRGSIHLKGRGSVGGFCYQLSGGKIINSVNEATVYSEFDQMERECGGVVAYRSGGEIKNTINKGTVTGYYRVGGVIGLATNWSGVKNNKNEGVVTGYERVGGVVGSYEYTGANPTIESLTNEGAVHGERRVGGVFGNITADWSVGYNNGMFSLNIVELINSGTIDGTQYVGGTVGYLYTRCTHSSSYTSYVALSVRNFANTGDVEGDSYVGGLFGYAYANGSSSISNSTSSGHIHAVNGVIGGLAGKLENVSINSCSNAGTELTLDKYLLDGSNSNAFLGGYVGYGYNISGCNNATEITYLEKGRWVGGIAGYVYAGITNCNNTANITAVKAPYVGGVVGEFAYSGGSPSIKNSSNTGDISGESKVAGILGSLYADWSVGYNNGEYYLTIDGIENSGNITATGKYAGGIVGYLSVQCTHSSSYSSFVKVQATNLTNSGDISGNAAVGGLVGYGYSNNGSSFITRSSSSGNIHAVEYLVGGLAGQLKTIILSDSSNEGSTVVLDGRHLNESDFDAYLGGYVGYGYNVSGCNNDVDISYTDLGRWVGGIVGYVTSAISNCMNSGNITAAKSTYVGGLVGEFNYGGGSPSIRTSQNSGTITGASNVGGLFGRIYANWSVGYNDGRYNLVMDQLTNSGDVTASGTYVGSITGYVYVQCTHSSSYTSYVYAQCTTLVNSGAIVGGDASSIGTMFGSFHTNHSGSFAKMCRNTGTASVNGSGVDKAVGQSSNFTLTFAEE